MELAMKTATEAMDPGTTMAQALEMTKGSMKTEAALGLVLDMVLEKVLEEVILVVILAIMDTVQEMPLRLLVCQSQPMRRRESLQPSLFHAWRQLPAFVYSFNIGE